MSNFQTRKLSEFDQEFIHSDTCEGLMFIDRETDPNATCRCQLKYIKSFLSTALKEQREELAYKIKQYKGYYNPTGDELNKGKHIACDDILTLLSKESGLLDNNE